MKPLIFVVEDEASLRELYTFTLEGADFEAHCFESSKEMFSALESYTPSLFILDIMLQGEDGFSILSRLKSNAKYRDIPVIMVSAKGEELSKVKGLTLGADDYIAKPFGILEFVARVKANLRKTKKPVERDLIFKDIVVNEAKHMMIINGTSVQTSLKEYNLLKLLCEKAETVIDREKIFSEVWGSDYIGETRTLDMHIRELRKKLEDVQSVCEITTIRGVGYMLK